MIGLLVFHFFKLEIIPVLVWDVSLSKIVLI